MGERMQNKGMTTHSVCELEGSVYCTFSNTSPSADMNRAVMSITVFRC